MLGAVRRCPNCGSSSFERTETSRAIQCATCLLVVEERTRSALPEYRYVSVSEELHWAVTPDMHPDVPGKSLNLAPGAASALGQSGDVAGNSLSARIPGDPITTPGFVTAFRVIAPLQTPLYGATAGTMSGALSEMERLLGPLICEKDSFDPRGDARYVVAVYFEIIDLSSLLDVDCETSRLAVRVFCHTASTMFIRNKEVEQMAAASLLVASSLRRTSHDAWVATRGDDASCEAVKDGEYDPASVPPTPEELSAWRIAEMCSIPFAELSRVADSVRDALTLPPNKGEQLEAPRPEEETGTATQGMSRACAVSYGRVPGYASQLLLGKEGTKLALTIVERAYRMDVCPRRAPASVSAACIYLTCQLLRKRPTQAEVCRVMKVTEVTLRKVYRELCLSLRVLVPEEYSIERIDPPRSGRPGRRKASSKLSEPDAGGGEIKIAFPGTSRHVADNTDVDMGEYAADNESQPSQKSPDAMIASDSSDADVNCSDDGVNSDDEADAGQVEMGDRGGALADERAMASVPELPVEPAEPGQAGKAMADASRQRSEPDSSSSPRDPEQKRREARVLAMLRSNPAAAAAFEEVYASMPKQTAVSTRSVPPPPPPPLPPTLPYTRSAKARGEATSASPVSQASPGAYLSSAGNHGRAMLETAPSANVAKVSGAASLPPPPPPPPPLKSAGSPETSRRVLRVRRNDNTERSP